MKKIFPHKKTIIIYILSFLIPVFMMIAIYASLGITYGGKVTVLGFDLKAQYCRKKRWIILHQYDLNIYN